MASGVVDVQGSFMTASGPVTRRLTSVRTSRCLLSVVTVYTLGHGGLVAVKEGYWNQKIVILSHNPAPGPGGLEPYPLSKRSQT